MAVHSQDRSMAKLENQLRRPLPGWLSWYRDPVIILAISLVFALDQITKAVVRNNLVLYESVPRDGVVRITRTFNTGTAFGLFPDQTFFLILASFVGIAILLLVYRHYPLAGFPLRLSLGMQLGGAIGNLVDRVREGRVTDFIDLGFWPVFNVADASIVVGIIILAGMFLLTGTGAKRRPAAGAAPAAVGPAYSGGTGPPGASECEGNGQQPDEIPRDSPEPRDDKLCSTCRAPISDVAGERRCSACGATEWVEETEPW